MWKSPLCASGLCRFQGDGVTFDFPDLFQENKPATEKQLKDLKRQERQSLEQERKDWDRLAIPTWFR